MRIRLAVGAGVAVCALVLAACGQPGSARIVVAAGTTIVDSGLVEGVVAAYRDVHPDAPRFSVVAAGSTEVLALGERGAADVLISHLPDAEERFLAAHPDAIARPVFASRFLLVGPPGQTIVSPGMDVSEAFAAIARRGATFVTRADESGTNAKERAIWAAAGIEPSGSWYVETGLGMGHTLQVADQRNAFTLAEEGAFRAARHLGLVEIPVADPAGVLVNPYRAIAVDPQTRPVAADFVHWLATDEGRAAVLAVDDRLFGAPVYRP